ncbi:EAL domain-containing protein [Thalassospira australica]|uniref:EAL domain-containing protein n=1 Tax=Thalassospira australica TaxID=1528106 RepID=UPI0009DFC0B5|nr:EAL domain-containing protein [Thalassospira australica]
MMRPTSTDGRPSGLTVGTLSPGTVLNCSPQASLGEAITKMRRANSSSIIVVVANKPVGIVTEHDLLSLPATTAAALSEPVSTRMSEPVHTISVHATPQSAIVRMRDRGVRHLVTIDAEGCLVGIVSQTDLIRHVGDKKPFIANDVADAVRQSTVFAHKDIRVWELRQRMHSEKCDSAIISGFPEDLPAELQTGIITERDILRHLADEHENLTAGDIATRPVTFIQQDMNLDDARNLMMRDNFRHLVVHNHHGETIGVLSFADLLEFIEQDYLVHLSNLANDSSNELTKALQSLALANKLIENSPDCVMICNATGEIEAVNPAFTRVTGYQAEEVIGKTPSILKSGRQNKAFYDKLWTDLSRTGKWEGEIWNRRKSGEIYAEWLSIMAVRDGEGAVTHYASIFTDISGREKNREDVLRIAFTDELTGMPNRRRFSELLSLHIGRARRVGRPLTIAMLDIDNFQRVNNALGHNTGDDVLVEVARRISRELGQDAVVARVGADEFAAILPHVNTEQEAFDIAEKLLTRLGEAHLTRRSEDVYLSASIGIASFPEDANDTSNIMRCAELAMIQAKEQGRNRVGLYSVNLHSQKGADLALETALRRAIDNEDLHLVYQPQFDAKTGEIAGVEALLRWTTAEGKTIPPSTFIPIAEEMGVIGELGRWVIRTACKQLVAWRQEGLHNLRLAVNVSVQQFYGSMDFAEQLRTIIVDKGVAADRLEIEITESLFMRNIDDMRAKLQRLRNLGVRIALDDFGTGFSSLSYLRTLPFDVIKLDRSFVSDIEDGAEGKTLAITILNMAHNLGKTCIAEGVETNHQFDVLRDAGCELIQGYLLGRPMAPEDISKIAKSALV